MLDKSRQRLNVDSYPYLGIRAGRAVYFKTRDINTIDNAIVCNSCAIRMRLIDR